MDISYKHIILKRRSPKTIPSTTRSTKVAKIGGADVRESLLNRNNGRKDPTDGFNIGNATNKGVTRFNGQGYTSRRSSCIFAESDARASSININNGRSARYTTTTYTSSDKQICHGAYRSHHSRTTSNIASTGYGAAIVSNDQNKSFTTTAVVNKNPSLIPLDWVRQ